MRSPDSLNFNPSKQRISSHRSSSKHNRSGVLGFTAVFTAVLLTLACGNSKTVLPEVVPHTASSSAATPAQPSAVTFGVNGHPFSQSVYSRPNGIGFATQIKLIKNAGFRWYRFDLPVQTEPSDRRIKQELPLPPLPVRRSQACEDTQTGSSDFDELVEIATACEINLLPVLMPAVNRDIDSISELYNESFVAAFKVVRRYKSVIHVWELSNEEDVFSIMKYGAQGSNGIYPAPNGDLANEYYAPWLAISEAIIRGLADGARAADPQCQRIVNFGWIHSGFIQNLENDVVPFDIVGVHWYADTTLEPYSMGDITCPGQLFPCPTHLLFFNLVQRLQQITNNKPIWLTENGYVGNVNNKASENLSLEDAYLPFAMQNYMNHPETYPFPVVLIYELLDESVFASTQSGLFWDTTLPDGRVKLVGPKPIYQSIQNLLLPH